MAPPEPPPAGHDLAANQPGQAARAKALELKEAAPIRTFIARLLGVHTEEWAWRVGADGEVQVGRSLSGLGPGWCVLHAVPVGQRGSDIDHVVIGPPGVFTLNTKNHSRSRVWVADRAVLVNGQKTPYLRNSRFEARRSSHLLTSACGFPVTAQAVIVVLAADLSIKTEPTDVFVVGGRQVVPWLLDQPSRMPPEVVAQIFAQARRESTWQPASSGPKKRTGAPARASRVPTGHATAQLSGHAAPAQHTGVLQVLGGPEPPGAAGEVQTKPLWSSSSAPEPGHSRS